MAIKVLTPDKKNPAGAALDVGAPDPEKITDDNPYGFDGPNQDEWFRQAQARHDERHDPDRPEVQWTKPPISNSTKAFDTDESLSLEMGVVYKLQMMNRYLIQNVSDNEDDYVEFSMHGDPNGTWGKLAPGNMLRAEGDLFLLNRTHMENLRVAMIMEP